MNPDERHFKISYLLGNHVFYCECITEKAAMDILNSIFAVDPRAKILPDAEYKTILHDMVTGKRTSYNNCPIAIAYIPGEAY